MKFFIAFVALFAVLHLCAGSGKGKGNTVKQVGADTCIVNVGPGFISGMLFMALCTPYETSAAIIRTIGYHIMSMPCIIDGNPGCLRYDIALYGAKNFGQIAARAGLNTKVGKTFTKMENLCVAANADLARITDTAAISRRTCKLVEDLAAAIKEFGANKCSPVQMVAHVPNLLSILSPQSLKKIFSPYNLKNFVQLSHLSNVLGSLKNLGPNLKSLAKDLKDTVKHLNLNILNQ